MRRFRSVLILMFAIMVPFAASGQGRPAGVGTAEVTVQTVAETVSVFGQIVAGRESAVAARVGGVAASVPIRVGDTVEKGQVLAQLDTELLAIEFEQAEAQIAIAEAGVAVADARLEQAEKALRRAEKLSENSAISEAQLDESSSRYAEAIGAREEARARIKAAQAALAESRYRLDNATVRAPFGGVVLQVSTEVGQFIAAGSEAATLIDIDAIEVEANVPSRFIDALSDDLAIDAQLEGSGVLELRLRAILPTEFSATRTRPVRFEIEQMSTRAAVGQSVNLRVPVSAPREVVVVPKDALAQGQGGWSVFVNAEGVAQPRSVTIGMAVGDGFEVLSGLAPGDEVVVRGNERLRPGQPIAPAGGPPRAEGGGGPPQAAEEAKSEETQG